MYQHDEQDLHIFLPVGVTPGIRESGFPPGQRVRMRALNPHTHLSAARWSQIVAPSGKSGRQRVGGRGLVDWGLSSCVGLFVRTAWRVTGTSTRRRHARYTALTARGRKRSHPPALSTAFRHCCILLLKLIPVLVSTLASLHNATHSRGGNMNPTDTQVMPPITVIRLAKLGTEMARSAARNTKNTRSARSILVYT